MKISIESSIYKLQSDLKIRCAFHSLKPNLGSPLVDPLHSLHPGHSYTIAKFIRFKKHFIAKINYTKLVIFSIKPLTN